MTEADYTLEIEDAPDPQDERFVQERLSEYNRAHVGSENHRRLAIFLRDADGSIVAGLLGDTYWGWLSVGILWVNESLRGRGFGQRLLRTAEEEALRRGCQHAHLDTMDFQALPFYLKQGYTVWGELHGIPEGHTRYFLRKDLQPAAAAE